MLAHRRPLAIVLALALVAIVAACAVNPVTGERELTLISESQEVAMGAEADGAIVAQYGVVEDEGLRQYVARIGQEMVPVSHRPDLQFHFRVLDDPVVNAFALPGGYTYVTRGILAYLNSEAALAGVIGHEIGHVTARHGVQRMSQQTLLGLGLGLGAAVSETFAQFAGVASTASQLLLLKYGRDQERQSDRLGVEYATKVGYDTDDMGAFFRTLDRLSGDSGGRLPSWASTHPDPGERYEKVLQLTDEWQAQTSGPYEEDRDAFLEQIDGIVFGPDPRNGYVKGGEYLHPNLEFRFPVPSGWELSDTRQQVTMVAPEKDSGVIMTLGQGSSASAEAQRFAGQEGITVVDQAGRTINGLRAMRLLTQANSEAGSQSILSHFIEYSGQVFVFHGITPSATYGVRADALAAPALGFRRLDDASLLNVQPVRVKVVQAPSSGSFANVVSRWPLPADAGIGDVQGLAVLNGMSTDSTVQAGQRLKVLVR